MPNSFCNYANTTVSISATAMLEQGNAPLNTGFARAVNLAAAGVRADYLLLLNPDTELRGPVLRELREAEPQHAALDRAQALHAPVRGDFREVGIELYQQLLEEAVAAAKGRAQEASQADWSPTLNLGIPVLIPEEYVADLSVRMGLYRRLGSLSNQSDVDAFAAELVDRFGKMPVEAEFLLKTIALKLLCRAAGVEKIDAGEKALVISFRDNKFARPERLIAWIQKNAPAVKVRPDQRVLVQRAWADERQRLSGVSGVVAALARLASSAASAEEAPPAARNAAASR